MVSVLPVMLEEPGESDLFSQLKEHQLQEEDRADIRQRSRPATRT
jgi:hypothetical protein